MAPSIVDTKTEEEAAILAYYRSHPGANWAEAAKELGMDGKKVCGLSMRLWILGDLRVETDPLRLTRYFARGGVQA